MAGLFQGKDRGVMSMRRLLAFLFAIASIVSGQTSVYNQSVWQVIAASYGAPGLLSLFFMGLTTWEDVQNIVKSVKGDKKE